MRKIIFVALVIAFSTGSSVMNAEQPEFEQPTVLSASEILPDALLSSDHHKVAENVTNDGYLNTYTIQSDYGEFLATGESLLAVRVWETHALARIEDLSKTKVFVEAVRDGALGQLTTIFEFGKHPVSTIKGLPGGVKRMFTKYKRDATEGIEVVKELVPDGEDEEGEGGGIGDELGLSDEPAEMVEDLAKSYMDVDKAEREWAGRLGTDPYTSNETLNKAIEKVAWIDRAGRFGAKLAPIPRIPGVNYVRKINQAVWDVDPRLLRDHNESILRETGVDEQLIESFFANQWLSPTQQTRFIGLLGILEGIGGRDDLVVRMAELDSEVQARFYLNSVAMMVWHYQQGAEIIAVVPGHSIPTVELGEGTVAVYAAVDHLCWTAEIAAFAQRHSGRLDGEAGQGRELWLFGSASERCKVQLTDLGWHVNEGLRAEAVDRLIEQMGSGNEVAGEE